MALRHWNGHTWRRISETEARLRRARGETVIDGDAPEHGTPAHTTPEPVKTVDEAFPPVSEQPTPNMAEVVPAELTDDELERLTAPGGEG